MSEWLSECVSEGRREGVSEGRMCASGSVTANQSP